jgi:hypothetical protein
MKAALAGQQFLGPEDLLTGIQEILSEIQRSEMELVFQHWIERVQWVLDNGGDDFQSKFIGSPFVTVRPRSAYGHYLSIPLYFV